MNFPAHPLPAQSPRVVVTGAGIVTALGLGWQKNAEGFRTGKTAFRLVKFFDANRQRVKTAAEVDLPGKMPATLLSARQSARLDRASALLLLAAVEAWQQSGWQASDEIPLVLGTTSGGMPLGEDYFRQAVRTPRLHRRQPTRAFQYQSHSQSRIVLDALGLGGSVNIISNACASGACAIGQAWELIRSGAAEKVFAGGYDVLSQLVFSGFDALQALSPTRCRPFDKNRDGLAVGEGAAMLTLETLESAQRRGAEILGEIIGYATTIDRHHLTQPHPEGNAAFAAMSQACATAGVTPAEIDYVNAHGTGTPLNDSAEAAAINQWAGARAATLPVSSTKASVGHLLGGAGAVEAVVCLMALRGQWLPPELALETPDPVCKFPLVTQPQNARVNMVLSNSFGFGGINATLIFRRWA
jgi:3-oxoacyl-[acyl-carrier-protein] synthase II